MKIAFLLQSVTLGWLDEGDEILLGASDKKVYLNWFKQN